MNYQSVKAMTHSELLKNHEFRHLYVTLYNTAHGNSLDLDGDAHFVRETGYLKQILMDSAYIRGAATLSIMTMMLDLAYHGLSLQPGSNALAYVLPRKASVKNADGTKTEELRVTLGLSPYGEIALRIRSGIIRHVDNPVLVYKGDFFEKENGVPRHAARFQSEEIERVFVKITRYDGSFDYKDLSYEDMMRFKAKSDSKTGTPWTGGFNGGPLPGMWRAKVLKHAFSTYPRLKLGQNTEAPEEFTADAAYANVMSQFTNTEEDDDLIPQVTAKDPPATPEVEKSNPASKTTEEHLITDAVKLVKKAEENQPPPPPPPVEISKPNSDIPTYEF